MITLEGELELLASGDIVSSSELLFADGCAFGTYASPVPWEVGATYAEGEAPSPVGSTLEAWAVDASVSTYPAVASSPGFAALDEETIVVDTSLVPDEVGERYAGETASPVGAP